MILILLNSKSYSTFLQNLFQNLWKNKIFSSKFIHRCYPWHLFITYHFSDLKFFLPLLLSPNCLSRIDSILLEDRHMSEGLPEDLMTSLSNCPLPASPSRAWESLHSIILQPAIYSWSCHAVKLRPSLEYRKILMEMAGPFLLYNPLL